MTRFIRLGALIFVGVLAFVFLSINYQTNAQSICDATTICIGDRVKVNVTSLAVRQTAGGSIISYARLYTLGTVLEGPSTYAGYTWWKVRYDTGVTGWSVARYLLKISVANSVANNVPTPTPTPTPTPINYSCPPVCG